MWGNHRPGAGGRPFRGVIAAALLVAGVAEAATSKVKPVFTWIVQPTVRVCRDASLDLDRVRQAMDWWEDHGVRFAGIEVAPCAFRGDGTPLRGDEAGGVAFNTITLRRQSGLKVLGKAGDTHWATYGKVPLWAVVSLGNQSERGLTLEHELGHALGFPHVGEHGHIMNARLDLVGDKARGLDTEAALAW